MFRIGRIPITVIVYFMMFIPFTAYTKYELQRNPFDLLKVKEGESLSSVRVSSLDGSVSSFGEISKKNKLTLVQFWATWCVPCRLELPHLAKVYNKYREDGLGVVAVSIDDRSEVVDQYAKQVSLPFPIIHDRDGSLREQFGIKGVPVGIVLDKEANVLEIVQGSGDRVDQKVDLWLQLLK